MTWHIDGSTASLVRGQLTGKIDLGDPAGGLAALQINGVAAAGRLCAVALIDARNNQAGSTRWKIEDAYVRGDDLIAIYRPRKSMPFRWQVYWRMSPPGAGAVAVLDVVLSVQTPLLETWPVFEVRSQFEANDVDLLDRDASVVGSRRSSEAGAVESTDDFRIVFGRSDDRWSFAEMVHPADFESCRVTYVGDGGVQTQWRLGSSFMEKGVIRRIQLRTAILTADAQSSDARAQLEELVKRPPPLTA